MENAKLEAVYVSTITDAKVHSSRGPKPQQIAKLQLSPKEFVFQTAEECKKAAVIISTVVVSKIFSMGRSVIKYLKKDYLQKEGVPFTGLVVHRSAKGIGKNVKSGD